VQDSHSDREGAIHRTPEFWLSWEENLVLYFHSATEGRKLNLLAKNSTVGFELDTGHELVTADLACNWGMKYKSIIGTGESQLHRRGC
jgi:uncharacterized protein